MSSLNATNRSHLRDFTHGPSPPYKSLPVRPPNSTAYDQYRQKVQATQTTTEIQTEKPNVPRSRLRHWMSIATWWQEATAMILLIGSTVASFATLHPYQGKPLPEWPYAITIGTLLSAYSVVLRLAATFLLSEGLAQTKWRWFMTAKPLYDIVLHDNASRGPIGAFGLLWRLPFPVTWQWMGCVLAIIALLVGPFTQQVLQYEECAVLATTSTADIPRTSVFMGQGVGSRRDPSAAYISLTMQEQASLNRGIYTPGSGGFTCDSGNCTFLPYFSVGYCSSCTDISSSVKIEKFETTTMSSIPDSINPLSMNYSSPRMTSAHGSAPMLQHYATAVKGYLTKPFNVLIGLPGTPLDPSTGQAPTGCDDSATNQTWRCQGYAAASCSIYPCVRRYSASVINGVLNEHVLETERSALRSSDGLWFDWSSSVYAALDLTCLDDRERDALRRRNYTIASSDTFISYNITSGEDFKENRGFDIGEESVALEQGFIDRGCLYTADANFDDSLQDFMRTFAGDLTGMAGDSSGVLRSLNGSQFLQSIFNYGNYSLEHTQDLFDNVTTSLTNYMRNNPGSSEQIRSSWTYDWRIPKTGERSGHSSNISLEAGSLMASAPGEVWTTKTCVRISWPWLALPAALALLTLVFFVGVTISCGTLSREIRTWKTSPLPLMFFGPSASASEKPMGWSKADSQHVDDMNAAARRIDVALVRDRHTGNAAFQHRHRHGMANQESDHV